MKKIFLLLVALYVIVGSTLDTLQVRADGANDDLTASVSVGTSAPTVGTITCVDGSTLTLSAETTKLLNCSATISDLNGYADISSVRGVFHNSSAESGASDTRDNYKNATCAFTNAGSGTTRDVQCTFSIWYHANPAAWTVYFNATDSGGLTGSNTTTVTLNSLVALNVSETSISFGTVSLGGTSSEITTNIKNTGNVVIDLNINESLYSGYMNCTDTGSDDIQTNAASTGVRYNTTTGFSFAATSWNLTSTNPLADVNWVESSDSGTPTAPSNPLYWLIKLPASGLTGSCSTTVRISAAQSA